MQVLGQDWLSELTIASATTITLQPTYQGKQVRVTVGGIQLAATSAITLNLATTGFNGLANGTLAANTLYYIYAVQQAGVLGLVASTSGPAIGPTGFASWKEIGRFRTLFTAATAATVANRVGPGQNTTPTTTEWQVQTGTIFGTQTGGTQTARWRRVHSSMEIEATVDSPSAWGVYQDYTLPSGYTLLIANASAFKTSFGAAVTRVANAGLFFTGVATPASSTVLRLGGSGSQVDLWAASINNPAAYTANQGSSSFHAVVPIAEFVGLFD